LLPFGIPTLIIAEDPQLLAAARAAYAYWRAEAPDAEPALELRLEIGSASSFGVCLDISVEGSRLRLGGRGARGIADAATGKATATVPGDLANDGAALVEIIDTLLLFLLARRGRTPVHASAFVNDNAAVLLAGRSGSGKSTLALAAAQQGFPLLSDDTVFVQREPDFAVWGWPRPIHVFPEDAPSGEHETRLRNRKLKTAVPLTAPALKATSAVLVLLEKGSRLALRPIDWSKAVEELMRLDPGFDLLEQESRAALQDLASGGAWCLTLTDDPAEAIALLVSRLPELSGDIGVHNPR
jgi:hypothetical protein